MTRALPWIALLALLVGSAGGYWLGRHQPAVPASAGADRKPLYYRHPMNPKVTSPTPAKDEMGMDYLPVYADELPPQGPAKQGRILYYRHPMGAADTSPTPKKDEMGMDYIPVYEGELVRSGRIDITPDKIQKLGVKTETIGKRRLLRNIRALGSIQMDERRVHAVTTKFEGWVRRLAVAATGASVKRGQPLLEVYSPDLISAQQDYLIARQGRQALQQASPQVRATADRLVDNALQRLRYWDISAADLRRLQSEGRVPDSLSVMAPAGGVVIEKPVLEGMRFMPGDVLYRIADLSSVWLMADVYEQDLDWVREGQSVAVHVKAYPDRVFDGRVGFIYPTLATETRTVKVRVEMPNPHGLLKPGLYGSVDLAAASDRDERLAVPESAVIDSGTRQLVLVQTGDGLFEPRPVRLGRQADGYFEVLDGVAEGESVVVRANFLIDAESQLKSALDSFGEAAKPEAGHGGH